MNILAALAADKNLAAQLLREAAESVAGVDDPRDRLAQHVGYLQGTVRSLCARFTGAGAKPQRGCAFAAMTAGDATVLVEYEYQPAEAANLNLESPMCGPGCEANVSILQALVNGEWCDPYDVFDASLIVRWGEKIAEAEAEQAREAKEPPERERYDDALDLAGAAS